MLGIKRPWVEGCVEPSEIDLIYDKKISEKKEYDQPILWSDFEE